MDEQKRRIAEIEAAMAKTNFWSDKDRAQQLIKEMNDLKDAIAGVGKYDKGGAVMTILAGAGGDDAEDFAHMLYYMYEKYISGKGWTSSLLHKNENDHGGYRNITIEVTGVQAYGNLKHESGVHRLVRISPFNAKKLRHTSFCLVDVLPKFERVGEVEIPESDLKIEFSKSSGPGGQNANKRETAVRIVHIPTNLSAHVESQRTQLQNKEKAQELLEAKIFKLREEAERKQVSEMQLASTTEVAWGNQIRSYVLHPYKMVKDHRTDVEVRDVEKVLEDGALDELIAAAKELSS
jgi:peptide chain release factor 2